MITAFGQIHTLVNHISQFFFLPRTPSSKVARHEVACGTSGSKSAFSFPRPNYKLHLYYAFLLLLSLTAEAAPASQITYHTSHSTTPCTCFLLVALSHPLSLPTPSIPIYLSPCPSARGWWMRPQEDTRRATHWRRPYGSIELCATLSRAPKLPEPISQAEYLIDVQYHRDAWEPSIHHSIFRGCSWGARTLGRACSARLLPRVRVRCDSQVTARQNGVSNTPYHTQKL